MKVLSNIDMIEANSINNIPVLDSALDKISQKLYLNNKLGFIYFEIGNSRIIKNTFGESLYDKILSKISHILLNLPSLAILMKDDIVVTDSFSKDCFFIFLIPSSRYFFALEDLRLTLNKILYILNEQVNEIICPCETIKKIEFCGGCNFIFSDPLINVRRLIYDAHKEAILNNRVQEFILRFINNISHELRTPLTCIKGYLETLIEGPVKDPETFMGFIKIINFETNRLVTLTSDLLDLSLIQGGFIEMKLEPLEINKLISKAILLMKSYSEDKNIRIFYNKKKHNYKVLADGDRLVQVLVTLLDNSIRYSPEDSEVNIEVKPYEDYLRVEIQDHGYGISQKFIPRIFEVFERVDDDRSLKKGGRGLGLTIAKSIIELHGGIIGVESKVGKGSNFYFLIKMSKKIS